MKTFRLRTVGNPMGWLSLFSSAGKGLLALLLLSFSFAAQAKHNPFYASKDYFHWADLTNTWDNGNLSKNKSAYKEGDVVPHAYVPENLVPGQSYSILLKYDYYLSTKDAGGFSELVWDPAQFAEAPTGQLNEGSITGSNKSDVVGPYYATNLTITSAVAKPDETSGNTTLKVWEITFTYNGTTGSDAALYFGLRLAKKDDVNAPSNGAGAWSGASLQTYLDPSSDPGTRSLQIDPGAIVPSCQTPPTVTAGTYGPVCKDAADIVLNGQPAGGTWTGTGVISGPNNTYSFDPSVGTQTLTYTFTDPNGCSNSDETTINVYDLPTPGIQADRTEVTCTNPSATLTATGGTSYLWSTGETTASITVSPTTTTTYTVTVTGTGGCTAQASQQITVDKTPPTAGIQADRTALTCTNTSATLTASGGVSYLWSTGETTPSITVSPTTTTTYTVTVTGANGCTAQASQQITVPDPLVVTAGSYGPLCSNGTPIALGGTPPGGTWTGTGVSGDQTSGYTFNPAAGTQTLTYSYTDPNTGCSGSATVTITVETAPTADFTYKQTCAGGIAKIELTGSVSNNVSQTWSTAGDGTFDDASKLNAVYTPGPLDRGKGSVDITLTANTTNGSACGPVSKTYTVAVSPCGPYFTYTQGYYGNPGGMACTPTGQKTTLELIQQSVNNMPGGKLYLGKLGASFSMTASDAAALIKIMPGGGSATKLGGNYDLSSTSKYPPLKNGRISNVLLSQTITLALNVAIPGNDLGSFILKDGYLTTITRSGSSCTAPAATCPDGTVSSQKLTSNSVLMGLLNGKTVTDLYNMASAALGGTLPAGVSYSDISGAVDAINKLFDEGRYSLGYFDCAKNCSNLATPCTVMIVSRQSSSTTEEVAAAATKLAVSAFPNPFTDRIRFTIQAPKAGRATLEVYNLLGQKVGVPFEGQLNAGESRNVEYTAPVNHRSSLIYRLSMNGEQISGKLMGTRQ